MSNEESDSMMMTDGNGSSGSLRFTDVADLDGQFKYNPQAAFTKVYFEKTSEATDIMDLARNLYDLREYRKCAHLLKKLANPKNQSALFLHYFALF